MKCKREGCIELAWPGDSYDGTCGRECQNMMEWYERGREEERADVVAWLTRPHDLEQFGDIYGHEIENGEHEVKR
jgi:hypothetical protein